MKKVIFLSCLCAVFLTGCSSQKLKYEAQETFEKYIFNETENYLEYQTLKETYSDSIDSEGFYTEDEINNDFSKRHEGTIHVSFAINSLMDVQYYYDKEHYNPIDIMNCYVYPGDMIYAEINYSGNVRSNTYEFQGLKIVGIGESSPNYNYISEFGDEIRIPSNCAYNEISILPFGAYNSRSLNFDIVCDTGDDNNIPLSGKWDVIVGNQVFSTGTSHYAVNSSDIFRIKANYDKEQYYFIDSEPKAEKIDEDEGVITFQQYDAANAVNDYKVVLGKYYSYTIDSVTSDTPVKIYLNGKELIECPESGYSGYAKLGDTIEFKSDSEIKDVKAKNLIRLTTNGCIYSVYNESGIIEFNPEDYVYQNGTVEFYDVNHKLISDVTEITIGDEIYYKGIADEGYVFSEGTIEQKITADSNIDYFLQTTLKFTPKAYISLKQPERGGRITYYLNGEEISSNMEKVYVSTRTDELTASFTADNRYKVNNISDGKKCIVEDENHEVRFKDNAGIILNLNDVFVLSDEQKAVLSVSLDDSVGKEFMFYVYNGSDLVNENQKSYKDKKIIGGIKTPISFDTRIVDKKKIETVSGLKISVSNGSLLSGEALRVEVTKKNTNKKETTEILYILSGSGSVYVNTDSGDSAYYTDIEIEINKVKGSKFNPNEYKLENATVDFSYADVSNNSKLKNGDFVDRDREIMMVLTPDNGYSLYQQKTFSIKTKYKKILSYEEKIKYAELDKEYIDMLSTTKIERD